MELKELREPVRRNMVKSDLRVLDILATGHNLIKCIETESREWKGQEPLNVVIDGFYYTEESEGL